MTDTFALALEAHRSGQLPDAERLYLQVLAEQPGHANALNNLGTVCVQGGDLQRGLHFYNKALAIEPGRTDTLCNRGNLRLAQDRPADALSDYDSVICLDTDSLGALYGRGLALGMLGRPDEALQALDHALRLKPDHVRAETQRAALLLSLARLDEALAAYRLAWATEPGSAKLAQQCATILWGLKRTDEALAVFDQAMALGGDNRELHTIRASLLEGAGRFEEAMRAADRALVCDPAYAEAYTTKGTTALSMGDHRTGWALMEWRWKTEETAPHYRALPQPQWSIKGPTAGQTILLHAEQGAGDSLQMLRYAPLLARMGAAVIVCAGPELTGLAAQVQGVGQVCRLTDKVLPAFDQHCPMMSLPFAFGTNADSIPNDVPYLTASQSLTAEWLRRLPGDGRLRVGLTWSGSPNQANDHNRSLPMHALRALDGLGAQFISLQPRYREGDREQLAAGPVVHDVSPLLTDFDQTAALVETLDLVISVCTSTAHLAGGMGKPVWVMLAKKPDHRWGMEGRASRWYPTARLFRQSQAGDWDPVVAEIRDELSALISARA